MSNAQVMKTDAGNNPGYTHTYFAVPQLRVERTGIPNDLLYLLLFNKSAYTNRERKVPTHPFPSLFESSTLCHHGRSKDYPNLIINLSYTLCK